MTKRDFIKYPENLSDDHGSPRDRGSADRYYARPSEAHYYPEGTGNDPKFTSENMTLAEVIAYQRAWKNEKSRKNPDKEHPDMSAREIFTEALADKIRDVRDWTAPYGILTGLSNDHRSRTITFGLARILDATVSVYSSKFITLHTSSFGVSKFSSEDELLKFLKDNYT